MESQQIIAAQKGDLEAFNELVLLHQEAVFNLAYRILGDPDAAEDITQNTFITAFRSLVGFRNGSFRAWLFRIAINACYDEFRRNKRRPTISLDSEDLVEDRFLPAYDWPFKQITPEQSYERTELRDTIQQALNLLDPEQRAVVVLIDLQERDYREVAQILRIPLGTVKSRLARGRMRLRQLLIAQNDTGNSRPRLVSKASSPPYERGLTAARTYARANAYSPRVK